MSPPRERLGAQKRVLTDGTRSVEIHQISGNLHHDGLIMVYLPKEKLLSEADAYTPPAPNAQPMSPPNPFTVNLSDNIAGLNLDVERVLPELVSNDAEGFKQVDYSKLPLLLLQAVMTSVAASAGSPCTPRVAAASIRAMPCHQKFCTEAAWAAAVSKSSSARAGSDFLSTRPSA